MLTDGKPPVAKPETDEAAAAAAASGAADAAAAALGAEGTTAGESVEVTEVKAEGDAQEVEKDDVVVIGDDSATGTANENESVCLKHTPAALCRCLYTHLFFSAYVPCCAHVYALQTCMLRPLIMIFQVHFKDLLRI